MTLKFHNKPEVRLKNPPLNEVICQVRFPPILRIAKDTPNEFQELIRGRFPGMRVEHGLLVQFPGVDSSEKPLVDIPPKIFRFFSADETIHVALAADFFALSTKHYTHWGDFVDYFQQVEQAIRSTYLPAYATRIGLRFINFFTMLNTGCETLQDLLDMFRPEFTCIIRADAWDTPDEVVSQIVLQDNEAKLALRSRYGMDNQAPLFVLDFDYYQEGKMSLDGLMDKVERYHDNIYDAFRWCLQEDSLQRFSPQTT